mgnify:FL=1
MAIPVFSNKPKVCTRQLSLDEILTLEKFNVLTESSLETSTVAANANVCGDPNLGTTFVKNVVHQVIRCGGDNIDINFFRDLFPQRPTMVGTKRWYNHYICDTNMNIYAAASVTGSAPGAAATFQVLKQFHGGSGHYSLPSVGYSIWDKDRMIEYRVTAVDNAINYAHKVTIQPYDENITVSIKANVGYLVTPARRVGGDSCKQIENSMSTIGYSQEVRPLRVRKDWEIEIDLLRGYLDKIQYSVIYDIQGNAMDAWDVYEAQQARLGVQMGLNIASFIGTPVTNSSLISDSDLGKIDQFYTGFYGLLPSIKFGNGVVYPFRSSVGFDFEADGEPIFLWQDSQKRTSKFLVMHGLGWRFGNNNRTNKLVARTDAGKFQWEAYRRLGALSGDTYEQELAKLGIESYKYEGFELDFKRIGAFSDVRYAGSDYYSNLAICMPKEGAKENGRPIDPVEFYQVGQNGWTGDYFESYVDNRKQTTMCESIQGYSAESLAFALHCPDLWVLIEPATDA